jgi:hypothetical protein
MPVPDFSPGEIWTAGAADSIGLWLVKTQTVGTGVSSVTVSDAFSATYDHYKIVYQGACSTGGEVLRLRLGSNTANYYGNVIYANYGNGAAQSIADAPATSFTHCSGGFFGQTSLDVTVFNPFLTTRTGMSTTIYMDENNAGSKRGTLLDNNSYTAFTLLTGAGTITGGTIRVYGYRN